MSNDRKIVWVAFTNSDCNEGRGFDIPMAVCYYEATAMRLAKKRYIQGSDGPVKQAILRKIDDEWFVPCSAVQIESATKEDLVTQALIDAKRDVIDKARLAGLTDEEIATLCTLSIPPFPF